MSFPETLRLWMEIPTLIEERRFLEEHPELVNPEIEERLGTIVTHVWQTLQDGKLAPEEALEEQQGMAHILYHMGILHDTQLRSASQGILEAIRETYVNKYSSFVLDLPPDVAALKIAISNAQTPEQQRKLLETLPAATDRR